MMDSPVLIHVGLHAPSNYPQLQRKLTSKENGTVLEYTDSPNQDDASPVLNSNSGRFNITVGKFNPKTRSVPLLPSCTLKPLSSTQSEGKSSTDGKAEINLGHLSSMSSYDFSKIGSNVTSKSVLSGSDEDKSVRFSDEISSTESLNVRSPNSEVHNEPDLSRGSSKDRETDPETSPSSDGVNMQDLMGIFRNAVKHVINVNRFRKPDYFLSDFFGISQDRMENVGFSDELVNNPSLNQCDSMEPQPLLNKGSTTSLYGSRPVPGNVKKYCPNKNFNRRALKINERHSYVNELLEKLEDPLSVLKNDAPLSNILEEHVNTSRLIHPFYINYYPAKVEEEEEEEELESFRKTEPPPSRRRNWRPEEYPSIWAIFNNPKNGITSIP